MGLVAVSGGTNEVQLETITATGGTRKITVINPLTGVAYQTADLAFDATSGTIQAALDALSPLTDDLRALLDESAPKPKVDAGGYSLHSGVGKTATPATADPDAIRRALADFAQFEYDSLIA